MQDWLDEYLRRLGDDYEDNYVGKRFTYWRNGVTTWMALEPGPMKLTVDNVVADVFGVVHLWGDLI